MPYSCAFAVCTTFCHHIAGALIPIFGPDFPSACVPPEAPEHGRMVIDQSIISAATQQAEAFKIQYSSSGFSTISGSKAESASPCISPQGRLSDMQNIRSTLNLGPRLRLKKAFGGIDSPYGTDTDLENGSETSSGDRYLYSPITPASVTSMTGGGSVWTPRNMPRTAIIEDIHQSPLLRKAAQGPSPWLSAIPRSGTDMRISGWRAKRRVEDIDADEDYDGEESASGGGSGDERGVGSDKEETGNVIERKAAWLLMNLSVRDGECGPISPKAEEKIIKAKEGPRVKRRRATSM